MVFWIYPEDQRTLPGRYQQRRDLRHIKAFYRPFEKIQIDVKELRDMVELYPALR